MRRLLEISSASASEFGKRIVVGEGVFFIRVNAVGIVFYIADLKLTGAERVNFGINGRRVKEHCVSIQKGNSGFIFFKTPVECGGFGIQHIFTFNITCMDSAIVVKTEDDEIIFQAAFHYRIVVRP